MLCNGFFHWLFQEHYNGSSDPFPQSPITWVRDCHTQILPYFDCTKFIYIHTGFPFSHDSLHLHIPYLGFDLVIWVFFTSFNKLSYATLIYDHFIWSKVLKKIHPVTCIWLFGRNQRFNLSFIIALHCMNHSLSIMFLFKPIPHS